MTNTAHLAAAVITEARAAYRTSPETDGGSDAFDYKISIEGIQPYGELYQAAWAVANERHPGKPGDNQTELDAARQRAADLWKQIQPEIQAYAERCRAATYTGWSRESRGPIRRVTR